MNWKNLYLLLTMAIFCIWGTSQTLALDNLMALQGIVEDSGEPLSGNLTITIWNQSSGGTHVYSSGTDFNNKIIGGRFDIMIGQVTELSLEYGKYYYMDMSVNGQDLDFNGSERQIFQSSLGEISKSNILSTGTWSESEIPSLSSSWSGTIDSSRIFGSSSLNVNNSQYLEGLSKNDFLNNDTMLYNFIRNVNSTANIQSLGFNTTTQLDSIYYSSSNPSGYITDGNTNWDNAYDLINSTYGNTTYVRIGTSCQCSNIADRMYNFTVNANGLCTAVCGTDATGGVSGGIELADLFSRKYYYREAMFESVTSGFNEPWVGAAIASGTTAVVAAESAEHPGTAYLRTSTTASSGYSWQITGATTYLLGVNYTTRVTFKPLTKNGNVTYIRFGFQDIFTATGLPADGVFFNITQNSTTTFRVQGHSRNNNAQANTASTHTINNNTWYAAKIYINSTTLATFELYNETTLLWSDTVSSNIPTTSGRQTSNAFVAYTIGGTAAENLAYIDYISIGVNRELAR